MDTLTLLGKLLDPACLEINTTRGSSAVRILKTPYDSHTDFIYLFDQYNSSHPLAIGQGPTYVGFVSYKNTYVYADHYTFRELIGETSREASKDAIVKRLIADVAEEVRRLVGNKPVQVAAEAEMPWRQEQDRENHLKHGAKSDALSWFYKRKSTHQYVPTLQSDWSTQDIIDFINNHDDFVSSSAQAYITKHANEINFWLWKTGETLREYMLLESSIGEHHLRRAIAECLSDEKKVTITLRKDGKDFTGKIEANTLRRADSGYYSDYSLDAADRRIFEQLFGRSADIRASDITKIVYGKKILYERS